MQELMSEKKIAIMQPYLFPYIGYFQLIDSVDEFWIYDCVQYIRRGWMNRNQILLHGSPKRFSVSVERSPLGTLINEQRFSPSAIDDCRRFAQTLRHTASPHRAQAVELVNRLVEHMNDSVYELNFAKITGQVLKDTCEQFDINTPLRFTSELLISQELHGQERILEICSRAGASMYVNPLGGVDLYDAELFRLHRIDLSFLKPRFKAYPQARSNFFVPKLSVLDIIANLPVEELSCFVKDYLIE